MEPEKETTALALPSRDEIISGINAINEFQNIVHQHLVEGKDWGTIPGTKKPTLLKPGAEKITKLMGLADTYDIMDVVETWDRKEPLFRYRFRCKLTDLRSGKLITEGYGECNSLEEKYRYRLLWSSELPEGIDKSTLQTKKIKNWDTNVWSTKYKMPNLEVFSLVNTILKMAKKRALVDAALSAGRLSELFTQDVEDLPPDVVEGEYRVVPLSY